MISSYVLGLFSVVLILYGFFFFGITEIGLYALSIYTLLAALYVAYVEKKRLVMKASEMISVLARYIERFGDKPVLVNIGDGTFREFCAMDSPGLFNYVGKPPKNGKDKPYIYLDMDFV